MNCKKIVWQHVFRALNENIWNNQLKDIPVFIKPLGYERLGEFMFIGSTGINSIILSNDAELSVKEMIGVLTHEMVHQWVFQNHGCEVEEHGEEWQHEILRIGFDDQALDGLTFCTEELYQIIMKRHDEMLHDQVCF